MFMRMLTCLLVNKVINRREPDEVIGDANNPYLHRWWLIKNRFFNVYLHKFLRSDDDRALHDHPGDNLSLILNNHYFEWMPVEGNDVTRQKVCVRRPGNVVYRKAEQLHRIELDQDDHFRNIPVMTLFFRGKFRREWGFQTPKNWIHNKWWDDYHKNSGETRKG